MELREIAAQLGEAPSTVYGWGLSTHGESVVARPGSAEDVARTLDWAQRHGVPLGFRGAGCSYGDASQNAGGVVLDLTRFNEIKSLDPDSGILVAEPGVTLEQVWRRSVPLGYWPPVVSGTMYPTLGGLLAMNIHGKNNWRAGTIGSWVESFRLRTMRGEELLCSPRENAELFHAAIGGFGMLGCFTEITMRLKKIHSGRLEVEQIATPDIESMVCFFETHKDDYDYLVGWIDCFPGGARLGRGLIHVANYLPEGADPEGRAYLTSRAQDLPKLLLKVFPRSAMWHALRLFMNDFGMRLVNAAKYHSGVRQQTRGRPYKQPHAAFAFLLDYVPNWKLAYGTGGLIQYQTFVPRQNAARTHRHLLELCHRSGLIPYLGVYKRHRTDAFLMTHAVDGFSFAMDFRVTETNRKRLWDLTHRMDEILLEAGGRLYFAKDATMLAETAHRIWPREVLGKFMKLKAEHDPDHLLQTDLSRRVFPELAQRPEVPAGDKVPAEPTA